jgi:hypothetical protein
MLCVPSTFWPKVPSAGNIFPETHLAYFVTLFRSQLTCQLIGASFINHPIEIGTSPYTPTSSTSVPLFLFVLTTTSWIIDSFLHLCLFECRQRLVCSLLYPQWAGQCLAHSMWQVHVKCLVSEQGQNWMSLPTFADAYQMCDRLWLYTFQLISVFPKVLV